ncbi:NUDIX hydrolase [Nonomuraea guangzhouensis]|uniref:NUDIX hydrolase n=1 Tax=Nonomuraea guangzhouensis TaxID=1291555 RepID=A0ABW4GW26_9ACTN|nr:NUDIX hydrolase [Nonomuraea guangzhouensis]
MDVVDQWTGRRASALQAALRMTYEEFAEALRVGRRTVASWHADKADHSLSASAQRALDSAYEDASDAVRARFMHQLAASEEGHGEGPPVVPLTVAIAVVIRGDEALLVCRRAADSDTITWQFPAGVVKPGAAASVVAVRETLAETGVHCSVRQYLGRRLHPGTGVWCEYYLCDHLAGEAENRDADENVSVVWARCREVTKFIPSHLIFRPILEALEKEDPRERSA